LPAFPHSDPTCLRPAMSTLLVPAKYQKVTNRTPSRAHVICPSGRSLSCPRKCHAWTVRLGRSKDNDVTGEALKSDDPAVGASCMKGSTGPARSRWAASEDSAVSTASRGNRVSPRGSQSGPASRTTKAVTVLRNRVRASCSSGLLAVISVSVFALRNRSRRPTSVAVPSCSRTGIHARSMRFVVGGDVMRGPPAEGQWWVSSSNRSGVARRPVSSGATRALVAARWL